jgi:hypothetical protein
MEVVDLDNEPNYTALSHVWGPKFPAKQIYVNGHQVDITPNLFEALKQLRKRQSKQENNASTKLAKALRRLQETQSKQGTDIMPNIFEALKQLQADQETCFDTWWFDALCINQMDIHERGRQVSLMHMVYGGARLVVSWLGPEPIAGYWNGLDDRLSDRDIDLRQKDVIQRVNQILDDVASREYWDRVWIIQEVVLARKMMMLAGDTECPSSLDLWLVEGNHDYKSYYQTKMRHVLGLQRRRKYDNLMTLREAMVLTNRSQASDPRDKVFGVLALIERTHWSSEARGGGLYPNDQLSLCEVLCRAIEVLFETDAGVFLYFEGKRAFQALWKLISNGRDNPLSGEHDSMHCDGSFCGSLDIVRSILALGDSAANYVPARLLVGRNLRKIDLEDEDCILHT